MKGMMDGWHGDEYEVEFTLEELEELDGIEADIQNDEDWINSHQNITYMLNNPCRVHSNSADYSDTGISVNLGVDNE